MRTNRKQAYVGTPTPVLCAAAAAGRGPEWQFIDLLPMNAGKGSAMRHIQRQLGFDDASTVASGDAMNDLQMLQQVSKVWKHFGYCA